MNYHCKVKVILNNAVLILGVESFNLIITAPVINFSSGQVPTRVNSLSHDTKKAIVQTTAGQIEFCKHLFQKGFTLYFFEIFKVTKSKESFLCIDSQPGQTPTW